MKITSTIQKCTAVLFFCCLLGSLTSCGDDTPANPSDETQDETQDGSGEEEDMDIPDSDIQYLYLLGDVQEYSYWEEKLPYFTATTNWIEQQILGGEPVLAVLMTGDATGTNAGFEWENYRVEMSKIGELLPVITATGNHDYWWNWDEKIFDRKNTKINEYCKFPGLLNKIDSYFEADCIENIVVKNYIHKEPYYILLLEFAPRDEVVEWAKKEVQSHPERKYILLTHEWLTRQGERIDEDSYAEKHFSGMPSTWNSPEMIWNKLVQPNDNIAFVICGHNGYFAQLYTENAKGRDVPQLLFNLQYFNNGGDGWIQIFEIPIQQDSISVKTYNTITGEINSNSQANFKFKYRY